MDASALQEHAFVVFPRWHEQSSLWIFHVQKASIHPTRCVLYKCVTNVSPCAQLPRSPWKISHLQVLICLTSCAALMFVVSYCLFLGTIHRCCRLFFISCARYTIVTDYSCCLIPEKDLNSFFISCRICHDFAKTRRQIRTCHFPAMSVCCWWTETLCIYIVSKKRKENPVSCRAETQ